MVVTFEDDSIRTFQLNSHFFDAGEDWFPPDMLLTATLALLPGDINQDDDVDLLDIAPFVTVLTSGKFQVEADINSDGIVSLLDVAPFIQLLLGQ